MLYSSQLSTEFWADAIMHATWLYNRTYHSAIKMTPPKNYLGQILALDSLITFGAKITAKKPGTRPTATNQWTYDGIFLGYQNTMHNIRYWDINNGVVKIAKHDSKDELQYRDDIKNRSPASMYLLEVFTGSSNHTTKTEPELIDLTLKDETAPTAKEVIKEILEGSALPYTATVAAAVSVAAKVQVSIKENRRIENISNMINRIQINKMKNAFRRPDILDLKHELATLDISTNTYICTTSYTVPINEKHFHTRLNLVTQPHPDMNDLIELVEFQVGTTTHQHIRSWKRRLRGTIIISVNNESIINEDDIETAVQNARRNKQKNITIVFGSLVDFAMSGEGVSTLQANQLNVIAHHLHEINTKEDLWPNKEEWPHLMDSPEIVPIQMSVNKLKRRTLKETPEWKSFLKSEHKQLSRYKTASIFGDPVRMEEWMIVLPWVWTYLYKEDPITAIDEAKARGTCNGGPPYGEAVTLAETYAACVEEPIHCLTWAISAALNLYCKGCDVRNAFAEAPAPVNPFFMYLDDQYREWW